MSFLLRKLRGIAGMGLTWGTIWAVLGALLGVVAGVVSPEDIGPGESPARFAWILGVAGFVSGCGCALMMTLVERGRTILDVSLSRVALWGAVGGAVVPLLTSVADNQVVWTCPLGAILATVTVAVARRAERQQLGDESTVALRSPVA